MTTSEHTRAVDALAPFLALAKSASSPRAAADLVSQAISAPNTYIFTDLLQTPAIRQLESPDEQYNSHYRLLEIFAFGTYENYTTQRSTLPPLTDAQARKLRLLSLMTLAAHSTPSTPDSLSYSTLQSRLGLDTPHAIEQLVTDAIYADLVRATLDPAHGTVRVTSVAPLRDPAPGSLRDMLAELQRWEASCGSVLAGLEAEMAGVRALAAERGGREARRREEVRAAGAVAEKRARGEPRGGSEGGLQRGGVRAGTVFDSEDADAMDIDGQIGGAAVGLPM